MGGAPARRGVDRCLLRGRGGEALHSIWEQLARGRLHELGQRVADAADGPAACGDDVVTRAPAILAHLPQKSTKKTAEGRIAHCKGLAGCVKASWNTRQPGSGNKTTLRERQLMCKRHYTPHSQPGRFVRSKIYRKKLSRKKLSRKRGKRSSLRPAAPFQSRGYCDTVTGENRPNAMRGTAPRTPPCTSLTCTSWS